MYFSWCLCTLISFGDVPRRGTAGSQVMYIFRFNKQRHVFFQSGSVSVALEPDIKPLTTKACLSKISTSNKYTAGCMPQRVVACHGQQQANDTQHQTTDTREAFRKVWVT